MHKRWFLVHSFLIFAKITVMKCLIYSLDWTDVIIINGKELNSTKRRFIK